jgi:hypothetical protein
MKQRYQIALQLFPRLTWRQRDALVERRKNCRAYLQSFATLQATTGDVQTLLAAMKAFANQPTTPISSHQRQLLNSQFNASTHLNLKQIQGLHQQMCSLCQPTYFNVMKAMYPYLADAYALNIYVCNEKYKAGELIGIYKYPLEEIMERFINAHHPSSHPGWISFNQLKTLIESEKNPAYFGSWRL